MGSADDVLEKYGQVVNNECCFVTWQGRAWSESCLYRMIIGIKEHKIRSIKQYPHTWTTSGDPKSEGMPT